MYLRLSGLCDGRFGFKKNPAEARAIVESLIKKGNEWAMRYKLWGLLGEKSGLPNNAFEANPAKAKAFIEEQIEQGNKFATLIKSEGVASEKYGYTKNPTEARLMLKDLIAQGYTGAILAKMRALTEDTDNYGYEKNPAEERSLMLI